MLQNGAFFFSTDRTHRREPEETIPHTHHSRSSSSSSRRYPKMTTMRVNKKSWQRDLTVGASKDPERERRRKRRWRRRRRRSRLFVPLYHVLRYLVEQPQQQQQLHRHRFCWNDDDGWLGIKERRSIVNGARRRII